MTPFNMILRLSFLLLVSALLGLSATAQEENIETRSLLKLNLSDWYWARYELGYEHVLNESTSIQFAFAGIGAEENWSNYYYNNIGGQDAQVDINIVHGGWRFTPEIRRYAWVYGGMPEGVFVSVQGRVENWSLTVDEDTDDPNGFPAAQFQGELDGRYSLFHWGGGVMVGYQWYSDNGISIEVYTGPMFRSYSGTWTPDAALTDGEQEDAEDSLEYRAFDRSKWSTYLTANSGPGWRFGLTVGLGL